VATLITRTDWLSARRRLDALRRCLPPHCTVYERRRFRTGITDHAVESTAPACRARRERLPPSDPRR
jgi:hypothetical protein